MPDPRPLPSSRTGAYDDPPASSEASTPQTRRQRLRRAILGTNELAQEVANMANTERQARRSTVGGLTRRRQRSSSGNDELSNSTPEADGGDRLRRRGNKRRRLNGETERSTKKAIKYGYYGQVEPGKLRLTVESCDGGEHVDNAHPETSLGPNNLLRHDRSVYCSERPQSNIILKHEDDTPFCLEKLHIVGPDMGFTAPVRGGVVHVAMNFSDLQKHIDPPPHARRSRYSPYRRRRVDAESTRSSPELLSITEALRDPYINAAHDERPGPDPARAEAMARDAVRRVYGLEHPSNPNADPDNYCDRNPVTDSNLYHYEATISNEHAQPITILSDEDAGPEDSSPQHVLDYRATRERSMRRRHDIENWHRTREASGTGRADTDHWSYIPGPPDPERGGDDNATTLPLSRLLARQRMRDSPSSANDEEGDDGDEDDTIPPLEPLPIYGRSSRPLAPDVKDDNVTTAPFTIPPSKSRIAIRFHPPISGRFILLKLWAQKGKSNVDVQSVVAMGYQGGMRFFPAVEWR